MMYFGPAGAAALQQAKPSGGGNPALSQATLGQTGGPPASAGLGASAVSAPIAPAAAAPQRPVARPVTRTNRMAAFADGGVVGGTKKRRPQRG